MSDACCAPDPAAPSDHEAELNPAPWWRDRSLLLPALSGVALLIGLALNWANFNLGSLLAFSLALLLGAVN